jgi:hypothetical protein
MTSSTQKARANQFRELHHGSSPLLLPKGPGTYTTMSEMVPMADLRNCFEGELP